MNERIAQLITESGGYWNHGDFGFPSSVDFQEKDIEKFAELIVRECHKVVFQYTGPKSALNILEHFGLEE